MSLPESFEKIKPLYTLILIIVIAVIFFAFGRLSSLKSQKTPIKMEYLGQVSSSTQSSEQIGAVISSSKSESETTVASDSTSESGEVIGSKSGKKYYFPWCGTVKRILPQNQVHFSSIDEARKAGFTPGGNCKGLK